jgi:late competence protein required for DNA uptake (superfamily II DNA/RNA helicase)
MERLGVTAPREEVVEELVRQFRQQFAETDLSVTVAAR